MPKFYVYLHMRPNGVPFYVGKGKLKRCFDFKGRSSFHKRIVSKYGEGKILVEETECLDEAEAFQLEKLFIFLLREQGVKLANFTDGGEGCTGLVLSDEFKRIQSERMLGNRHGAGNRGQVRGPYRKLKEGPHGNKGRPMESERKYVQRLLRLGKSNSFGWNHTEESKKKISEKSLRYWSQGSRRWCTDGIQNRRVLGISEIPEGWYLGKVNKAKRSPV